MIVCDSFVFLHLHKSGGTFIGRMMMTCIASARRIGYHLPYSETPRELRHLPVLGSVRNPWSYYVSWFHFQKAQVQPNALYAICSEDGTLDFNGTIRNLVGLHNDPSRVDRLIKAFPDAYVSHGLNLRKSCISAILGQGVGFYTFLFQRLYSGARPVIIPMESLREGFARRDLHLSARETMRVQSFLRSAPDLNVSAHGAYKDYYADDVRELIARFDAPTINAFNYSFA
jgi:hypothetical protein